jgi:hydrogenase maturation protease
MRENPVRTVLIVGLGNQDRGDDGVGPLVIESLAGLLPKGPAVTAITADVWTLLTMWADFDTVICIDAAAPLGAPGRIHRFNLATEDLPSHWPAASTHALSLADAIRLSRVLGQAPNDVIVFAVEAVSFTIGTAVTAEVAAAVVEVVGLVVAEATGPTSSLGARQESPPSRAITI